MAKIIYSAIVSLDGYINDSDGRFDWSAPDEELHEFVNERERPIGTYLYGRRMYEVMQAWETLDPGDSPAMRDYAVIWRAADKVVFSRTLQQASSKRTRIEPEFDPEAVRRWKDTARHDLSIGGAGIAAVALRAGLVDECHLYLNPVVVGGGTRALPDGLTVGLTLMNEDRFAGGVVHLQYRLQ